MTTTSKAVGGRTKTVAAHGHLIQVMQRRSKWEAYLQGDVFPLSSRPMATRKELILWLRSQQGKRAIEVEERVLQIPMFIGSWGEK